MSKTKQARIVAPFSARFGDVNPGETVVAVTTSSGSTSVEEVEYIGYVERPVIRWNHQTRQHEKATVKFAQVLRNAKRGGWRHPRTKEKCAYYAEAEFFTYPVKIVCTLQLNRMIPHKKQETK